MTINQGRYNVFNEDGTMFKWGKEKMTATVTPKNRVQFFIGDNMEPVIEKHIPSRISTVDEFDQFTRAVCGTARVKYAVLLVEKLRMYQEAYAIILAQKETDQAAMTAGLIPVWRWIEKLHELNELQEVAQNLIMDTMGTLYDIAPEKLVESVTFIFTLA